LELPSATSRSPRKSVVSSPLNDSVTTPRKRGRPPKQEQAIAGVTAALARQQIIDKAVELAKNEPLSELSIIGLARQLGVTSAAVHYYVGSRDELLSGVVNQFFKTRVDTLGELTGDWRTDVERHARHGYALMTEYGGVLRYVMSHNRFRLFQQVEKGQTDYGLVYLNRSSKIFLDGGFSPEQAAMGYHLLAQYTMTAAYAKVSNQLPADHAKYILKQIQASPQDQYGAAHAMAQPFVQVNADQAFEVGLKVLLDSLELWRRPIKRTPRKRS
jgi:AcrR family transcriptional regulator